MIPFRHGPTGKVLGVNLKVMYSFMVAHPDFEPVRSRQVDFLLWRDPLERTVSAFFDKCRQAVDPKKVQHSQSLIVEALGLGGVDELLELPFARFVSVLPQIADRDSHYRPQLSGVELSKVGEVVDIGLGLDQLGSHIGVDFSHRINATRHDLALSYYSPEDRTLVERVYAADFDARGHLSWATKLGRIWRGAVGRPD